MHTPSPRTTATRALVFAAAVGAPLMLAGCVVEPNPYYAQPAYAEPAYYAAPAPYYYPAPAYVGPSVYIGGGGGWRGGGWRR